MRYAKEVALLRYDDNNQKLELSKAIERVLSDNSIDDHTSD